MMRPMDVPPTTFGLIDWLVLAAYLAAMVAIGLALSRKQEGVNTFFLGGRSMPAWAVSLSIIATSLSAATFVGVPEMAYAGDLTYLILYPGGFIGAFIVAFLILPPVYRAGTVTIYGYLGKRFGGSSARVASAVFLFGRLLASGARLFIAAIPFALILHGDTDIPSLLAAILLLGLVGTLYTTCGGIRAVIWTDALQIFVVIAAALISVYILLDAIPLPFGEIVSALRNADGVDKLAIVDTRFDLTRPYTLWSGVIAATFVNAACYGTDHDLAQRMLTTKSAWRGSAAMMASKFLELPVVCLFLAIGLLLSIYYGRPDLMLEHTPFDVVSETKEVYPRFLLNHLPAGIRGLSIAGLLAAAMSSFDSAINAMAATAVADLGAPRRARATSKSGADSVRAPRIAVVAMGLLLTAFAMFAVFMQAGQRGGTLIDFALGVMTFALAPLFGVFSAALFTKRGNAASVIAALAAGMLCVLLFQPYMLQRWLHFTLAWPWIWVIASPLSFAVCIAGKPSTGHSVGMDVEAQQERD